MLLVLIDNGAILKDLATLILKNAPLGHFILGIVPYLKKNCKSSQQKMSRWRHFLFRDI